MAATYATEGGVGGAYDVLFKATVEEIQITLSMSLPSMNHNFSLSQNVSLHYFLGTS